MDFKGIADSKISKIWFVALCALLLGNGSAFSAGFPANVGDLRGMASLDCSGALVRLGRGADQPAVLLTSGRCATNKPIDAEDALVDEPYDRGAISLFVGDETPKVVVPERILYATRTGTDVALIELRSTYRELEATGAKVFELSGLDAKPDANIQLVSGFWKEKQLCAVSRIVGRLAEDVWVTKNAYAMKDPCPTEGGWSGTPMVDPTTLKIVGLLSIANSTGGLCTLDNPCEIDNAGNRVAVSGRTYGQRTSPIVDCVTYTGTLDLTRSSCKLPKPKSKVGLDHADPIPSPVAPKGTWPRSAKTSVKR